MEKKSFRNPLSIKSANLLSRLFFSAKKRAEEEEQERALSRLIVFTRFPEPGESKTRLIPALGPAGAAELHRQMVEHTLRWAKELRDRLPLSIEIRYTGRPLEPFRRWLGPNFLYSEQGDGDLGQRMLRSIQDAFRMKVKKVLLIGTDCPDLSANLAEGALILLNSSDLVLGPADDGGYYLIGLRRVIPQLFQEIPWGTEEVFRKTQHVAQAAKLSYSLLPSLPDVDRPEDLPVWRRHIPGFREKGAARESFKVAPLISIIIPTLNEEENIIPCLEATRKADKCRADRRRWGEFGWDRRPGQILGGNGPEHRARARPADECRGSSRQGGDPSFSSRRYDFICRVRQPSPPASEPSPGIRRGFFVSLGRS